MGSVCTQHYSSDEEDLEESTLFVILVTLENNQQTYNKHPHYENDNILHPWLHF